MAMNSCSQGGAELAQTESKGSGPILFKKENRGLQIVAIGLVLGMCASPGLDLYGEAATQSDLGAAVFKFEAFAPEFLVEPPHWTTVLTLAVACWASYESLRSPRHGSMASARDSMRMIMQLLGDLMLIPLLLLLPSKLNEVRYAPTQQNESILASCPSLWRFRQTPWLRNPFLSFAALMVYDYSGADESAVQRELLQTPDGGTIALDWWGGRPPAHGEEDKRQIKNVLFIGSTWSGDALVSCTREVCKHFSARGWLCVVMVKRGCGLTMPNRQQMLDSRGLRSAPWCLSGLEDMSIAIDHVSKACHGLPICGLGFSLGASQLRNYVRQNRSSSKLAAVVIVDAGEDWVECIPSLDHRIPLIAKALRVASDATLDVCGVPKDAQKRSQDAMSAKQRRQPLLTMVWNYVKAGWTKSSSVGPDSWARSDEEPAGELLQHMRDRLAPAHGFAASTSGAKSYLRSCQPADPAMCGIPALELLTITDLLIDAPQVRNLQKMYTASENIITCVSHSGTHVVRWEGFKSTCWISKASFEFLDSALRVRQSSLTRDCQSKCL